MDDETKTVPTKIVPASNALTSFCIFSHVFVNYNSIIDFCQYLFFLRKISSKTKTFTTLPLHYQQIKRNWVLKIYYKMESNDKLKEINIKNQNRTCYYFDDIIKFVDFELDNF